MKDTIGSTLWSGLLFSLCLSTSLSPLGCAPDLPAAEERGADYQLILPPPQVPRDQGPLVDMAPLEGPSLSALYPNRSPLSGGGTLRVVGLDFRAPMSLSLGDQRCEALEVESETALRCTIPPNPEPGPVTVTLRWLAEPEEGEPSADELAFSGAPAVREGGFSYYEPLRIEQVEPSSGPAGGGTRVAIQGRGFREESVVRFAGIPARVLELESDALLWVESPPGPPGPATVTVSDDSSIDRLEDAFRWRAPVLVDQVIPAYGSTAGGERVRLYGAGLLPDSTLRFGEREAPIEQSDPALGRLEVIAPPGEAGFVSLSLENANGSWADPQGYLYLPAEEGPFSLLGVVPSALPSDEGGRFVIGGDGFTPDVSVTLAGQPIFCERERFSLLSCIAGPAPVGDYPLLVEQGAARGALTLSFFEPLNLYEVTPPRGAVAGGGVVYLEGRGLSPDTTIFFDEQPSQLIAIDRGGLGAWVLVPPHAPGRVGLLARRGGRAAALPDAFLYFDPSARYGGVYGDPVDGAVNVTVLDSYERRPVPGARVWVDPPEGRRLEGLTDEEGELTLGAPLLAGPLTVSAGKAGFEAGTFERVVSENITFLLAPEMPPPQDGEPPEPPAPVTVRGRLEGLSALPKPPEGDLILLGFVDTSHRGPLNRSSNLPPSPRGILREDGSFELILRAGQFALVATAAYVPREAFEAYEAGQGSYWFMREQAQPIALGLLRGLSLSPGARSEGHRLRLEYPCDQRVAFDFHRPSVESEEGPLIYEARAHLDLGPEGYWQLDGSVTGARPQLLFAGLPDMSLLPVDIELLWLGVSRSESYNPLGYQFQREARRPLPARVELRPVLGLPRPEVPLPGASLPPDRRIRWSLWPAADGESPEPPEATILRLSAGGLPLWTFVAPGGLEEVQLPYLPLMSGLAGLQEGELTLLIQPLIGAPLNYQDFDFIDLGQASAYSLYRLPIVVDQASLLEGAELGPEP